MVELTEEGQAVLEALLVAPVAWRSPIELASATGRCLEQTNDLLATLDAGGWLSAWERPGDVVVTLSVEAASRLEVRLVESGPGETPRWARRSQPEPPRPRAAGLFRGERGASLGLVVDSRPGPDRQAELAEEAGDRPACPRGLGMAEGLPRPTILVGTGLSPWPGPAAGPLPTCPACRSRPLGPSTYCLCCDRWGLDHLIVAHPAARPAPRRDPAEDARRAGLDRQARKRKRRSRRSAQARRRGHRRDSQP